MTNLHGLKVKRSGMSKWLKQLKAKKGIQRNERLIERLERSIKNCNRQIRQRKTERERKKKK